MMTLEEGDLLLTGLSAAQRTRARTLPAARDAGPCAGTPEGVGPIAAGQVVTAGRLSPLSTPRGLPTCIS